MPSKILYDTRTNEILRCQPEPHGSASLPSDEALYRSARVPENDKQYMKVTIIDDDILTNQAQNELRIVNNGALLKPKIELNVSDTQLDSTVSTITTINVEIVDTIDSDEFTSVPILVEDARIDISITDNQGDQDIDLTNAVYTIKCEGDRFRNTPQVQVEVI